MLQLAIEIGTDNVRAVVKSGSDYITVPLGLTSEPFVFPPMCLKMGEKYIFGQAAKLSAVARPNETAFLSDYTQRGMIDRRIFVAFIEYVCQRVSAICHDTVESITFVVSPHLNNPDIQNFLNACIAASGHSAISTPDSALTFAIANFNVDYGDKLCIIDMRDCPSYAAVVARSEQSYATMGSTELTDLSIKDCENFIEDTSMGNALVQSAASGSEEMEWIQSVMSAALAQYGLGNILEGKDAIIPLPFSSHDCTIRQAAFQNWIAPLIDKTWSQIQVLFQNIRTSPSEITRVVLMGQMFRSEYICERFKKCFAGYSCNPALSVLDNPSDDWAMCRSTLKTNIKSRNCALEL